MLILKEDIALHFLKNRIKRIALEVVQLYSRNLNFDVIHRKNFFGLESTLIEPIEAAQLFVILHFISECVYT